jgi:putative hydrolase of the HAD superfamily
VRAVLFDLDDTLFDHRHCTQVSLRRVHASHECFRCRPFDEIERAHGALLEELHGGVLAGRVDVDAARLERFRRLFLSVGAPTRDDQVRETAAVYRQGYLDARRAIDGAMTLLERLRERGAAVVIVSNNVLDEQREKLRHCGLDAFVDALVVSEQERISKPDPEIFRRALARVGAGPGAAVMVGDSWSADVAGARAAGIRAVWFNPLGLPRPEPAPDVLELRSFTPVEPVVEALLHASGTPSTQARLHDPGASARQAGE